MKSKKRNIAVVAHSDGGDLVMRAAIALSTFAKDTFAVAVIDSTLSSTDGIDSQWLRSNVVSWVRS